jgi:hypothetical protein
VPATERTVRGRNEEEELGATGARMERKILTLESKKGRGRWREEER